MNKRVLVTGSRGFIGRNLVVHLTGVSDFSVVEVHRGTTFEEMARAVRECDVVVHLAGVNRPSDVSQFAVDNLEFTEKLLTDLAEANPVPVIFASSTQASLDNPYGLSKRKAEDVIRKYGASTGQRVDIVRLSNVFGKWCRPNYNSAVATFVHNVSRGIELTVHDDDRVLDLVYIDDVIELFVRIIGGEASGEDLRPRAIHHISVGSLAAIITQMHEARKLGQVKNVGEGFLRAIYATYIAALEPTEFAYRLSPHTDSRGSFTEIVRTPSSGQVSYLTAVPGATRGSHFHHSKIEKFVVVSGKARFRFRCLMSGDTHEVNVSADVPEVVESIPGWVHDVTNTGESELVVLIWANEVFDPAAPDTYPQEV